MELEWRNVSYKDKTLVPSARWGHASSVVQNALIIFGGYANGLYQNDIWVYNQGWNILQTMGEKPMQRSNCTMNYHQKKNCLIVFAGGGFDKIKFGDVHILNLQTKLWKKAYDYQMLTSYLQRTYHTSQLIDDNLIVFGGQNYDDLKDLWKFNIITEQWKQLQIKGYLPQARRFHTSVVFKQKLIIIGGCKQRYRCLTDVFMFNISEFSENKSSIQCQELVLQNSFLLMKWGHTSCSTKDKIVVFGGRSTIDSSDTLFFDLNQKIVKTMKVKNVAPIGRRRHCSEFLGNTLIVFGGFNGQYYNDLYYLNLRATPYSIQKSTIVKKLLSLVNKKQFSDSSITLQSGKKIWIHKQILLSNVFYNAQQSYKQFLKYLQTLTYQEVIIILQFAYTGLGQIQRTKYMKFKMKGIVGEKRTFRNYCSLIKNSRLLKHKISHPRYNVTCYEDGRVTLPDPLWDLVTKSQGNISFKIQNQIIKSQKTMLCVNSKYFNHLLSCQFFEQKQNPITIFCQIKSFKIILKYLEYQILFIPLYFTLDDWFNLIQSSQFFQIPRLTSLCSLQIQKVTEQSELYKVLQFSVKHKIQYLQKFASYKIIRQQYHTYDEKTKKRFNQNNYNSSKLEQSKQTSFNQLYFELQHP